MDLTSIEFEIRKWETVRKSARYTILLLVALTIVNAVVQIAGGTFYLLYSDRAAFYLILLAATIFYAGSTNEYDVLPEGVDERLYPITGGVI
ncbi:MAG: hypothetical protein II797_05790, partial [Clostridia bacterium]|nr:hypothetical protein [Clostridia bacterium]